ncbi:MAG TPA: GC-type dockerin domain-anchored protein, partial [Phycisphaerales bacterium]|nr:GC-type dockerin domain-anchored protein [Phycisphaerales bacterium]
ADSDVLPANNPGAEYYVDCQYVTQDDAQWNNGRNNFSMRKLNAATVTSGSPGFSGATVRRMTALEFWALEKTGSGDQGINLVNLNFHERSMNVTDKWRHWTSSNPDAVVLPAAQWTTFSSPIQGRFIVASRVSPNAEAGWNYDYMVMNVNSHRAGSSFAVRVPGGAAPTGVGTSMPKYHSGDRVLNNPWDSTTTGGRVAWSVNPATAEIDIPGRGVRTFGPNAVMWGAMYNFRFTSLAEPSLGVARLGLFRSPTDATGYQGSSLAIEGIKVPTVCAADVGGQGGIAGPDGTLDNNDFIVFIDAFFNGDHLIADMGKAGGVAGPDNALDNNDFIVYIDDFFAGCGV